MPLWLFIFLGVLALLSGLGVILQRNPVHCLLGLAVNLLDMGVIFIGLGAVTVGFLQIIIYVGAILVLFLFVIWLLNLQVEGFGRHLGLKFCGAVGSAALAAELAVLFSHTAPISRVLAASAYQGSISNLGRSLFSDYLIAFEVTSILLLAAVVGAIGLARRLPSGDQVEGRGALTNGHEQQIPTSIPAAGEAHERRSA